MITQRILAAPRDGSLGPLLRMADDTLPPGRGYGRHDHRAVDVVAVVVAGELTHRWRTRAVLRAGDVGVLRAGAGLAHDEVAGHDGVRVLQSYLRSARPEAPARYDVVGSARGWVDLGRRDARLWLSGPDPAGGVAVPAGLRVVVPSGEATAADVPAGPLDAAGAQLVLVWQLDRARPAWALD